MGAPEGNNNARKERTRISVVLSIADLRLDRIYDYLQKQGKEPDEQTIKDFVRKLAYTKLDEELQRGKGNI